MVASSRRQIATIQPGSPTEGVLTVVEPYRVFTCLQYQVFAGLLSSKTYSSCHPEPTGSGPGSKFSSVGHLAVPARLEAAYNLIIRVRRDL